MSAYIGLGITQGAKNIQDYERGRATREAQQAAAQSQKDLAELQLNEYKAQAPLREQQAERDLARARQEARVANQQNLKSINFSAFDRYEADGDVRHLNQMLKDVKKNPIGARANSSIVRYDELNDTPEIRRQMQQAGFSDFEGILNDPEMRKSFVVTTDNKGAKQVWDVDKVYASTGYGAYVDKKKLEELETRMQTTQLLQTGIPLSAVQQKDRAVKSKMQVENKPYHIAYKEITEMEKGSTDSADTAAIRTIAEEEGIPILDATTKYYEAKNQSKGQTDQRRFIDAYLQENPNATEVEASQAYSNRNRTADSKNLAEADQYKQELDDMDFFEMDMSELTTKERVKVQGKVAKIMKLNDVELSNEDKRVIRDLNSLTSLGATAGSELTPAETGLLDSTLNSFKKYIFDEVGGSEATSSYETFRNIFRNSLYGATLTESEIKAFNTAAGTLGQKFQPAMSRLNTQMRTIKSQLESIRDTNDPYVAHYYLGRSVDEIDDAIRQIDSRLNLVNQFSSDNKLTTEEVMEDAEVEQSLDDILGDL